MQPGKAALIKRLARIEGQVRGISGMVEADRYCVDILTQVAAVKSALDAVSMQLLENHMKGCVTRALQQGDATGMVTELIDVVKKCADRRAVKDANMKRLLAGLLLAASALATAAPIPFEVYIKLHNGMPEAELVSQAGAPDYSSDGPTTKTKSATG